MAAPDMATMQALMSSMASGMAGGAPATAPPTAPLDPGAAAQAYAQMFQYMQHSIAAQGGAPSSLPGMPPMPFPGLPPAPYTAAPLPDPTVSVSVEGMKFQYQLTEDDLLKVFSRYGSVQKINIDEVGASATIRFGTAQDAQAAMNDLNGKVLNGLDGKLRINWVTPPAVLPPPFPGMPPYPGMPFPNWGFPAAPPAQAWPNAAGPCAPGAPAPAVGLTSTAGTGSKVDKSPATKGQRKFTCRFIIGIENDKEFQVARRIIGAKGANMKRIFRQTEAKLRLRGVGSGYFEGTGQKESSEPLQLCISCTSPEGYRVAVKNVEDLLYRVYSEYKQFCADHGRACPDLTINFTENQLVYNSRGGASGGTNLFAGDDSDDGGDANGKGKKGGGKGKGKRDAIMLPTGEVERGEPGPNAPSVEEIEQFINERNEARRANNFPEADRIRQLLHARGVALMDEPGGRGRGSEVTTWRYWRD